MCLLRLYLSLKRSRPSTDSRGAHFTNSCADAGVFSLFSPSEVLHVQTSLLATPHKVPISVEVSGKALMVELLLYLPVMGLPF